MYMTIEQSFVKEVAETVRRVSARDDFSVDLKFYRPRTLYIDSHGKEQIVPPGFCVCLIRTVSRKKLPEDVQNILQREITYVISKIIKLRQQDAA